jgi:hypothetical protein
MSSATSLERWSTLKAVQLARRSTLKRFLCEHNVRHPDVIEKRIDAIKSATALTNDDGVIVPNVLLVHALVAQLRVTLRAIESFNASIATHAHAHPDFHIFDSFPAAGAVLAPRLLVGFGEQRERYAKPAELQMYAGIAPVTERSGNSHRACGTGANAATYASSSAWLMNGLVSSGKRGWSHE